MCFRKRKPTCAEHPVGLTSTNKPMKQTQNKGGRPELSKGRVRQYIVSTRLDTEHYLRLRTLARTSGQRPAEIVRQLLRTGMVRERLRREHLDFMAQLKGISRNLNQLTRLAHAKGFASVVSRHITIVAGIESLLKQLRDDR